MVSLVDAGRSVNFERRVRASSGFFIDCAKEVSPLLSLRAVSNIKHAVNLNNSKITSKLRNNIGETVQFLQRMPCFRLHADLNLMFYNNKLHYWHKYCLVSKCMFRIDLRCATNHPRGLPVINLTIPNEGVIMMRTNTRNFPTFASRCMATAAMTVGGLFLGAHPAYAVINGPTQTGEICMQKVFGSPVSNSNLLNCTANDIRLSRATEVSPTSCIEGTSFDLTATFESVVTANSRYDSGFFFRIDGGANARGDGTSASGQCSLSALTPGVPPSQNLDGDSSGDLNAGTYNVTFTIPGVLCHDSDHDGFLNLPNCTSWHSNQGTASNINTAFDFDPDTKSKCVCDDTFQVPVIVETASLTVVKSAAPTSVPETGGLVTYTVMITNNASHVSLTIDSIIDDIYGDIGADSPGQTDNTCPGLIGTVLAPGGSTSCSFKATVSGDTGQTVTDVVEACGTDNAGHADICGHDDADVTITDVSSTPSLTKDAQSAACSVDVTYQVVVSNNSAIDTLTVNALNDDKFGDITIAHDAGGGFEQVVSTGCASGGLISTNGNYTCSFVGRINSDCDFTHTDIVTGNVTDDDNVTASPSDSASVTVGITGLTP